MHACEAKRKEAVTAFVLIEAVKLWQIAGITPVSIAMFDLSHRKG